jgi:predicted XRE-type DNA-binding protein
MALVEPESLFIQIPEQMERFDAPNPEEHFVKARLVFKIESIMKERQMRQVDAADVLGIRQPDVSKMLRGEFRQFSVERLLRFLVALGHDVEIVVRPHAEDKGGPVLRV